MLLFMLQQQSSLVSPVTVRGFYTFISLLHLHVNGTYPEAVHRKATPDPSGRLITVMKRHSQMLADPLWATRQPTSQLVTSSYPTSPEKMWLYKSKKQHNNTRGGREEFLLKMPIGPVLQILEVRWCLTSSHREYQDESQEHIQVILLKK